MAQKKLGILLGIFLMTLIVNSTIAETIPGSMKGNSPFPSYGTGKIIVRIYTNYFCPPCRAAEAELEPLLLDLVRAKKITAAFVDTPNNKDSQYYARYFLYAINKRNDFQYALQARSALFAAAASKINNKEAMEEYLSAKGIAFTPFDVKPVTTKFNDLLAGDKVTATPTCVIIKDGKSEKRVGSEDILKALKEL